MLRLLLNCLAARSVEPVSSEANSNAVGEIKELMKTNSRALVALFGLIVTLNLAIGQQTPPVASVLMTACSIAKANVWEVTRVNIYFIAVLLLVLLLVTYVPVVPMGLVDFFYR